MLRGMAGEKKRSCRYRDAIVEIGSSATHQLLLLLRVALRS